MSDSYALLLGTKGSREEYDSIPSSQNALKKAATNQIATKKRTTPQQRDG
jgi:hypothetical protein